MHEATQGGCLSRWASNGPSFPPPGPTLCEHKHVLSSTMGALAAAKTASTPNIRYPLASRGGRSAVAQAAAETPTTIPVPGAGGAMHQLEAGHVQQNKPCATQLPFANPACLSEPDTSMVTTAAVCGLSSTARTLRVTGTGTSFDSMTGCRSQA